MTDDPPLVHGRRADMPAIPSPADAPSGVQFCVVKPRPAEPPTRRVFDSDGSYQRRIARLRDDLNYAREEQTRLRGALESVRRERDIMQQQLASVRSEENRDKRVADLKKALGEEATRRRAEAEKTCAVEERSARLQRELNDLTRTNIEIGEEAKRREQTLSDKLKKTRALVRELKARALLRKIAR